jgi:hypothetical protein
LDVTIMISNPKEQAAAVTPAMTATPGLQPTVEKSESGLPVDVPLYPGATGLSSPSATMIQFQTDDTPEQVDQWYQAQMPAQNWSALSITDQQGTIIQAWTKDKRIVTISIIPQGKKTLVMIAFPNQ